MSVAPYINNRRRGVRELNVWCDECDGLFDDCGWSEWPREMWRMAREDGWTRTPDGRDLCPACSAARKAAEEAPQ